MTRRRLTGKERSRAIVRAALHLFARKGFRGATTREIARAAGVSEALLFKHFPDKRSLYRAILEAKIRDAEKALPLDAALLSLDDEKLLVRIAEDIIRRVDADDAFCRLMIRSALEGHDLARRFHRGRVRKVLQVVERRLRRRSPRGAGGPDPVLAARMFNGMILAVLLGRCIFRDPVWVRTPASRIARTLVRIFLRGSLQGRVAA